MSNLEQQFLKDLKDLVEIPSVLDKFDPNSKYPFGENIYKAHVFFQQLAKKEGFEFKNIDNYGTEIKYGPETEETFITCGHLDVVPVGKDWKNPPFDLKLENGILYARGVEDDKGPSLALFYALKQLKDEGYIPKKQIIYFLGSDEETESRGLKYYIKNYLKKKPSIGFIPDAEFPLIYSEKGILRLFIEGDINSNDIISCKSGTKINVVPEECVCEINKYFLTRDLPNVFKNDIFDFENNIVKAQGKGAHASTPWLGKNSVYHLFEIFKDMGLKNNLTKMFEKYFQDDFDGFKLGIKSECVDTGKLTLNLGIFEVENNHFKIGLDIRYPSTTNKDIIVDTINKNLSKYNAFVSRVYDDTGVYVKKDTFLVKTLMDVYQKYTNDYSSKPLAIGGGTYARLFENVVAFGAHFPNHEYMGHQKDEYVELDNLLKCIDIYKEAIKRLTSE